MAYPASEDMIHLILDIRNIFTYIKVKRDILFTIDHRVLQGYEQQTFKKILPYRSYPYTQEECKCLIKHEFQFRVLFRLLAHALEYKSLPRDTSLWSPEGVDYALMILELYLIDPIYFDLFVFKQFKAFFQTFYQFRTKPIRYKLAIDP